MEIRIKIGDSEITHSDNSAWLGVHETVEVYQGLAKLLKEAQPTSKDTKDEAFKFKVGQRVVGILYEKQFYGKVISRTQSIKDHEKTGNITYLVVGKFKGNSSEYTTYCTSGKFKGDLSEHTFSFYERYLEADNRSMQC